jgi:hypothetical protein
MLNISLNITHRLFFLMEDSVLCEVETKAVYTCIISINISLQSVKYHALVKELFSTYQSFGLFSLDK